MTPLCCNDANVDHCRKNFFYATPTCRNDFCQSVAEIVVIYIWALPSWISQQAPSCLVVCRNMVISTSILFPVSMRGIFRGDKESNIMVIR